MRCFCPPKSELVRSLEHFRFLLPTYSSNGRINSFLTSSYAAPAASSGSATSMCDLISNLKAKILTLDENLTVFPGHGGATTIAYEKQINPYLG